MLSENIDIMVAEGEKKGVQQGNAAMFKAMVAIRFGSVPEHFVAQIDVASADQLLKWGEKLFSASNIEVVFN